MVERKEDVNELCIQTAHSFIVAESNNDKEFTCRNLNWMVTNTLNSVTF